jgi:hypothetical protein
MVLCDKADQLLLVISQTINQLESCDGLLSILPKFVCGLVEKIQKQLTPANCGHFSQDWVAGQPMTRGMTCMNLLQEAEKTLPGMLELVRCISDKPLVCCWVYSGGVVCFVLWSQ